MAKPEEDWREEAGRRFKEKQQKGRFKLTEGENTIRVLPRVGSKTSQTPFFEYLVHREVGPNKRFVRCGKKLNGVEGDCWLCDKKIPELRDSGKEKRADALMPKEQFVVQVAAVDADTGKMRGPYLWTVPTGGARSLSARLLGVLKSTKRDYVDPQEGYNLTIERTGMGKTDTIYGAIQPDEDSSVVPEKILTLAKPFSSYVPLYDEEQQRAAYFGRDAEEAEETEDQRPKHSEEPEEEEPRRKTRASEEEEEPVAKPRRKPVEAEEEPEEEQPKAKRRAVEEEEPEEPAPKPKKRYVEEEEEPVSPKAKKRVEEEEPEEPEERPKPRKRAVEEEEEPEPQPKPKKRYVEEEEEPPAKPRKKPAEEEEPEERPRKKKPAPVEEEE